MGEVHAIFIGYFWIKFYYKDNISIAKVAALLRYTTNFTEENAIQQYLHGYV